MIMNNYRMIRKWGYVCKCEQSAAGEGIGAGEEATEGFGVG